MSTRTRQQELSAAVKRNQGPKRPPPIFALFDVGINPPPEMQVALLDLALASAAKGRQ